jgi:hypothetical protein
MPPVALQLSKPPTKSDVYERDEAGAVVPFDFELSGAIVVGLWS